MIQIPNWNKVLIAVVCALGLIYAAPNFFEEDFFEGVPSWLPGKQINLGLDLRGGVHLLMNVEIEKVVGKRLDSMRDATRQSMRPLRRTGVYYSSLKIDRNSVVLKLKNAAHIGQIRELLEAEFEATGLSPLGTPEQEVEITNDDVGTFRLTLTEEAIRRISTYAVNQSIEIIRRRIDEDGTKEPVIQQQGTKRILLQVPGAEDPEEIKSILGKTAQMTFHLVDRSTDAGRGSSMLLPSDEIDSNGKPIEFRVERQVRVSGEHLVDAQPSFDQNNRPAVSFRFDAIGGKKFGDTTSKNVGRLLAIVLDKKIISAPRIQSAIVGGSGIITGTFSVKETNDLALLLRAGALPAPLTFLEERTVGPGLGRDSIEAGKIASMIGMALVLVFMIASYGLFGILANVALLFNIALIVALLSAIQATLTLPGIAGIVLTIGMAVDANVLIFERIREEVRNGRTPISAIDAGYRRALTTIIDANVTTLIAAVLLYAFGTGPIKGFAVTLSIGLVTSMFTAVMVTRLFIVLWLRRTRPQVLPI